MQTPTPILNLSNLAASPNVAQKQNSNANIDTPFNHVLSREIADRQSPPPVAKAKEADKPAAAPPPAPAQPPGSSANAQTNLDGTVKDSANGSKVKSKSDADKDADAAQDAAAAAAAQSTPTSELLALVASFNQPAVKPADPAAPPTDPDARALGAAGAAKGKADLSAVASALPGKAKTEATEATDSKAAFADSLDQAASPLSKATTDAAALSGTAALKADDALTATKPQTALQALGAAKKSDAVPDAAETGKGAAVPAEALGAVKTREAATEIPLAVKAQEDPAVNTGIVPLSQQSALDITQAALNRPIDKLSPQVGTPAWDQALGQKVVWLAAGGQQSASLTLNPPDLGPLQVVLNVNNDQATATFTAAQPEVRQALEAAMPKLREMMSEAGIQLGTATVSAGLPDNRQNSPGEQPQQQQQRQGSARFDTNNSQPEPAIRSVRGASISSGQGLVDTFA
jgi:flagellar hook-length control protein FliK